MWRRPCGTTSPSVTCSFRNRRHAPPLAYAALTRHASATRIGLMDGTVPVEAMVSGLTHPRQGMPICRKKRFFSKKIQTNVEQLKKSVLLQSQNPPSLSTMLKCAGRFFT